MSIGSCGRQGPNIWMLLSGMPSVGSHENSCVKFVHAYLRVRSMVVEPQPKNTGILALPQRIVSNAKSCFSKTGVQRYQTEFTSCAVPLPKQERGLHF